MFFFSSRRRHTRSTRDWSSDVCSSDLTGLFARVNDGRRVGACWTSYAHRSSPSASLYVVANHLPALHHKFYAFEFRNVLQRVPGHRNDIGEFLFLNRADSVLPTHHLRRYRRGCLDRLRRSHAVSDQIGEFGSLRPVREGSYPRSK